MMNAPKDIRLSDISRYRSELMGAAMLFVLAFHVGLPKTDFMHPLVRCGNIGVDIFLFLSGIGLWYSWSKCPSLWHFFKRRYLRVYPVWLIVACLFYIPDYMQHASKLSPGVIDLIANILVGWSFWRMDDLTFWFVPTIMMLYTFAPAYMALIRRCDAYRWLPVVFIVWAVMVYYYPPLRHSVGHIEIFWSRVPIFLIGINCGQIVKEQRVVNIGAGVMISVLFVLSLVMCMKFEEMWRGRFPLFIERMVYIPLTVTSVIILARLMCRAPGWLCRCLAFIGTYSLEIYLVHYEFVLRHLRQYKLGFWLTLIVVTVAATAVAWLLNKAIAACRLERAAEKIKNKICSRQRET